MDRKVVEAKIDEVLNSNKERSKQETSKGGSSPFADRGMSGADAENPFSAFGGMHGMPNMAGMQGGKLPLKMRVMSKLALLATNPKFSGFLQKKWWPLWLVIGILFSGVILLAVLVFLIWRLIRTICNAYVDLFRK